MTEQQTGAEQETPSHLHPDLSRHAGHYPCAKCPDTLPGRDDAGSAAADVLPATGQQTGAEQRAHRYAEQLAAAGWRVTVRIVDSAPLRYSDGKLMTSGFRSVSVSANRAWYDGHLHAIWHSTTQPMPGGRRSTRYRNGEKRPFSGKRRSFPSERRWATWVEVEAGSNPGDDAGSVTVEHGDDA